MAIIAEDARFGKFGQVFAPLRAARKGSIMRNTGTMVRKRGESMEGAAGLTYARYEAGHWQRVDGAVIEEGFVTISVNGQELVTVMCTPHDQDRLALGFLRAEGLIAGLDDVRLLRVTHGGCLVDVWLRRDEGRRPKRRILTSGCGGGVTFGIDGTTESLPPPRLESSLHIAPARVCEMMSRLLAAARLYAEVRGVHTSALSDGQTLLAVAEDVGRHNTLDKLWGDCMLRGIETRDRILLATGRISSEMIHKAARMGTPIVASRTSPTSLSVRLAREWGLTLVGYVRPNRFRVYAGAERLDAPKDLVEAMLMAGETA